MKYFIINKGDNGLTVFLVDRKLTTKKTWTLNKEWAKEFFSKEMALAIAMKYQAKVVDGIKASKIHKENCKIKGKTYLKL